MDPTRPRNFRIDHPRSTEKPSPEAGGDKFKKPPENPSIRRDSSKDLVEAQLGSKSTKNIKSEPLFKEPEDLSLGNRNYDNQIQAEDLSLGDRNYAGHSSLKSNQSNTASSHAADKNFRQNLIHSGDLDTTQGGSKAAQAAVSSSAVVANNLGAVSTSTSSPSSVSNNQVLTDSKITFGTAEQNRFLKSLSGDAIKLVEQYKLTKEEAAAIHAYTRDEYYPDINKQFRTLSLASIDVSNANALKQAGVKNSDLANLIAAMVRGMQKLPPAQTDESYFMSLGRNVTMPVDEFNDYEEGAEVSISAFLSTTVSADEMITNHWWDNKDQALFIHQRVNGNGRDISSFSQFAKEKEILFLPNTKFKVTFKGEPTETEPGISSSGNAAHNPTGAKVKKILIAVQEIPSEQRTLAATKLDSPKAQDSANKNEKKNRAETRGTYFGIR